MSIEESEARRQAAVLRALWALPLPGGTAGDAGWCEQGQALASGLNAYQGNAAATAERALAAAYPTVQALLGDEALAGLARQLWHQHPPSHGDLNAWGEDLPDWLTRQREIAAWPYLPDCARLDWARHTAEQAANTDFDAASLALLGTHDPARLAIDLKPTLCVIRSDWPIVTLWAMHQGPESAWDSAAQLAGLREALDARQAETAVVWRPEWRAEVAGLPQHMAEWMSALLAQPQRPLSKLLADAPAHFDVSEWLALALRQGWIWRVKPINDRVG